MGLGLIPLVIIWLVPMLKVIVGWGIGTYPLIVIAFVAGMQFQISSANWLRMVCILYPALVSLGLTLYGGAFEFYSMGLVLGLIVDLVLLMQRKVSPQYIFGRTGLVLLFVLLLYMIGGSGA
jgi:hypothetical protein